MKIVQHPRRPLPALPGIQSLLDELLEQVFCYAVYRHENYLEWTVHGDGKTTTLMQAAPFRLAAVCRRWRLCALHMRMIWSHVCLPDPTRWSHGLHAVEFLRILLERSRGFTVSVLLPWSLLFATTPKNGVTATIPKQCIKMLSQQSHRWVSLQFRGPATKLSEELAHILLDCQTPALRQLCVSFDGRSTPSESAKARWCRAPRFRIHVASLVDAEFMLEHCAQMAEPMPHLARLRLDVEANSSSGVYHVLVLAPNVEQLSLHGLQTPARTFEWIFRDEEEIFYRILLLSLWRIHVSTSILRESVVLLTQTTCLPNLAEVDLPWGMACLDDDIVIVFEFFNMHCERLHVLTFHHERGTSAVQHSHPEHQSELSVIKKSSERLWKLLSLPDTEGKWTLPRLSVLNFVGIETFPDNGRVFRGFEKTRCSPGTGGCTQLDVRWYPADQNALHSYEVCVSIYDLRISFCAWRDLLEERAEKRRAEGKGGNSYFASTRYMRLGLDHAF